MATCLAPPASRSRSARKTAMSRRGLVAALPLAVALIFAPPAFGAGDPVASGSFHLKLSSSFVKQLKNNGVAMKPKAFSLAEGAIDPTTGTGTLTLNGTLRFKHGHKKVTYKKVTATLGSGGVLAGNGTKLFKLGGGRVVRNGFGANISGVKVSFLKSAAKKISRKLGLHSLHRASAGSLSVSEQPQTVEVTGGTVHVVPNPNLTAGSGTVASKLSDHCINFINGNTAIAPAIKHDSDPSNPTYDFPVTGGTIGPQGTDGVINQAGGIEVDNVQDDGLHSGCSTVPLATLQQADFADHLLDKYISSHVVVSGSVPPAGDHGVGIASNLDLNNATVSADPANHAVTINGVVIRINGGTALYLNQTFAQPASSYDASKEFVPGDLFGTENLSVTTR
jgi:hypothetical protein